MISFTLNGTRMFWDGDENLTLLKYLRKNQGITTVKDGCSGQAACGACMVEIDGKPKLSCVTKLNKLEGCVVNTLEGIPSDVLDIIARAYVEKGAVQCGFCTPGFLMRTKILFQENSHPTRDEIKKALTQNLCRCTGYIKIIDAIEFAAKALSEKTTITFSDASGKIGKPFPKYEAMETAIGKRPFINDINKEGQLYGALKFSDYPRAKVLKIDYSNALTVDGVIRIFTAKDVPGDRMVGIVYSDWPLMISEGEITRYIGDVIAGVVATDEDTARKAVSLIKIDYEVFEPLTDIHKAFDPDSPQVHPDHSNLLGNCAFNRGGNVDEIIKASSYVSSGIYQTQRIEHAFLETEGAIAFPDENGNLNLLTNSQGVYVDRKQCAKILNIPEEKIHVTLIPTGGGFGGKEDMTVQGHVTLFSWLLKKPVKLVLNREESMLMHPKRHPVWMEMAVACDETGKLTALKLRAKGDTGAYASVGTKVMERVAGHAAGGYFIPAVDIEAKTIYTNNIPCGAMRGFGANQVCFALESCIDDLCKQGGFDRWKFRYDNALVEGSSTATGQILDNSVGIRTCLEALRNDFYNNKIVGLATGIKNCGVGNGMPDFSDIVIHIVSDNAVEIHHGWTEMGQGIHNMVIQTLCQETGIDPAICIVKVETTAGIPTGMTTSSRATVLACNAIIDASAALKNDLTKKSLKDLKGKKYIGKFLCDWTTKPGADVEKIVTHFAYGYAAQMVVLDDNGNISKIIAAHDGGKTMNPIMFEGQIEGAVLMGMGYALTEDFPMEKGMPLSLKLRDCRIPRADDTPEIKVIPVEVSDPVGPYGAKGIGEIGLVPTAAAIANALTSFDGIRRYSLPLKRVKK